jgi:hypothetical protein
VRNLEFFPYILPLPKNTEDQRRFYRSVFGSDTALEVLRMASLENKIYQKDLIKELKYSNKTILETLKRLVSLGVLQEGMEKMAEVGKTVWVKWYSPTNVGRWIVLLFLPPKKVDSKLIEDSIEELFGLYVKSAIQLCKTYNLKTELLRKVFEDSFL